MNQAVTDILQSVPLFGHCVPAGWLLLVIRGT